MGHPVITVQQLAERIRDDQPIFLLDCREQSEWDYAHIEGARHIPMMDVPQRLEELPGDVPIAVCCHHGVRSAQVAAYLRQQGYDPVYNVSGGIDAWSAQVDPGVPRY